MKKFKDFYEAWWFLNEHSAFTYKHHDYKNHEFSFGTFHDCFNIEVVKVNPTTKQIDDNEKLNIKVEVWLECGKYVYEEHIGNYTPCHDVRLDCGADTFKDAIINLANLVRKYYGSKRIK